MILHRKKLNVIYFQLQSLKKKKKSGFIELIVFKYGFIVNFSIQLIQMNQNYVLFNQEQEDSLFIPSGRHKGLNKNTKIKKSTKFNSSLWTFTENQKYVQFLIQQQSTMQNVQERKQSKVFVRMSQFIKGRSPEQCRSHHQKIIKYYHSVQNIISNLMKVKEKQLIKKAKQLQETQKTMPMQFLSNQAQIQQKQSVTISLISTFTPEPQILQSQDMWDMIDQKMWIR